MLMATTAMQPAGTTTVIGGGPFNGWRVIGAAERRIWPPRRYDGNSHGGVPQPAAYMYSRTLASPVRMRPLTVPTATPRMAATSLCVWPP